MDQATKEQENRDPGQIDDSDWALSGQETSDLIEVTDRFVHFSGLPAESRQPNDG